MSKTVDELIGVYIEASNAVVWEAEKRGLCPMTLDMQRAGIAAVVRELMEHFVTGASTYAWDADDLHAEFMKLLGTAGDEVAGGPTREDGRSVEQLAATSSHAVTAPATAPAPAVCEWTPQRSLPDWRLTSCGMVCTEQSNRNGKCQSCGKPIKFTEAQR